MTAKVFLDTDVIIDYLTDRKPFSDYISHIFELSVKNKVSLHISAVSINNIYYIIRKLVGHSKTLGIIERLIEMVGIVDTSEEDIVQALKNNFSDFEDSIQYSTALKIDHVDAIITRNLKDYRNSAIAVMTPTTFLKTFTKSK